MAEEKLTVAELLARSGGSSRASDKPRRSRSRSAEDNTEGVSVFDLTGAIPVVTPEAINSHEAEQELAVDVPDAEVAEATSENAQESSQKSKKQNKTKKKNRKQNNAGSQPVNSQEAAIIAEVHARAASELLQAQEQNEVIQNVQEKQLQEEHLGVSESDTPGEAIDFVEVPQLDAEDIQSTRVVPTLSTEMFTSTDLEDHQHKESAPTEYDSDEESGDVPGSDIDVSDADAINTDIDTKTVDDTEQGDSDISIPALILEVLISVFLGVCVFIGFSQLWGNFRPVLVGILALAVTGLLVWSVHKLLKSNDKPMLFLAFIVGLILCFGPMFIVNV